MNTDPTCIQAEATHPIADENASFFPMILRLTRWVGVSGMALAGYLYVMRDGIGENMMLSYYTFLGFTVLLVVSGWLCARRWQDSSGGRTLFGLAAALLPVHMAQHGAFLLSNFEGLTGSQWYLNQSMLITVLATSLPILLFTTWLGYAGWLRQHAKVFAPMYVVANLALLLPMRSGLSVMFIGVALAVPCVWITRSLRKNSSLLATTEGKLARLTLVLPFALLIGRAILYGSGDAFLYSFAFGLSALVLSLSVIPELESNVFKHLLRVLAAVFVLISWVCIWSESIPLFNNSLLWVPAMLYVPPFVLAMVHYYLNDCGETKVYRILAGLAFAAAFGCHLLLAEAVQVSLLGLVFTVLLLVVSLRVQEKWMLILSAVMMLSSSAILITHAVHYVGSVSWISVGLIGLLLVVSVSILEKKRVELLRVLKARTEAFRDWDL